MLSWFVLPEAVKVLSVEPRMPVPDVLLLYVVTVSLAVAAVALLFRGWR